MQDKSIKKKKIVKKLLQQEIDQKTEEELLIMLLERPISIDVEKQEQKNATFGDRLADKIAEIVGSWCFILLFSCFLLGWIFFNGYLLKKNALDPFPFILLNLLLSRIAALQAPVIMMSQNRQAKKDSLRNQNDYQIDLKSELILEDLHQHIKEVLENQSKILQYIEKKK